jgi:hypothetical protein
MGGSLPLFFALRAVAVFTYTGVYLIRICQIPDSFCRIPDAGELYLAGKCNFIHQRAPLAFMAKITHKAFLHRVKITPLSVI